MKLFWKCETKWTWSRFPLFAPPNQRSLRLLPFGIWPLLGLWHLAAEESTSKCHKRAEAGRDTRIYDRTTSNSTTQLAVCALCASVPADSYVFVCYVLPRILHKYTSMSMRIHMKLGIWVLRLPFPRFTTCIFKKNQKMLGFGFSCIALT